jgi:hypothetical protein
MIADVKTGYGNETQILNQWLSSMRERGKERERERDIGRGTEGKRERERKREREKEREREREIEKGLNYLASDIFASLLN